MQDAKGTGHICSNAEVSVSLDPNLAEIETLMTKVLVKAKKLPKKDQVLVLCLLDETRDQLT